MGKNCGNCRNVNIIIFDKNNKQDFQAFDFASGLDLRANKEYFIKSNEKKLITTGLRTVIPIGYEGQIRSRSGLAANKGIFVLNSPGTIDCDYRGELIIVLYNLGHNTFKIAKGNRIAQLIISPVPKVKFKKYNGTLDAFLKEHQTKRGEQGFGSTGV